VNPGLVAIRLTERHQDLRLDVGAVGAAGEHVMPLHIAGGTTAEADARQVEPREGRPAAGTLPDHAALAIGRWRL
jgi:hypothetical protein